MYRRDGKALPRSAWAIIVRDRLDHGLRSAAGAVALHTYRWARRSPLLFHVQRTELLPVRYLLYVGRLRSDHIFSYRSPHVGFCHLFVASCVCSSPERRVSPCLIRVYRGPGLCLPASLHPLFLTLVGTTGTEPWLGIFSVRGNPQKKLRGCRPTLSDRLSQLYTHTDHRPCVCP